MKFTDKLSLPVRAYTGEELWQRLLCTKEKSEDLTDIVVAAADRVSRKLKTEKNKTLLLMAGYNSEKADNMLAEASGLLESRALREKMRRELGYRPFLFKQTETGYMEKYVPLGVLLHVSAGNASGLPAYSVLEGLLAGNINMLKLPGQDDGLSTMLLRMLVEEEPLLAEYIYVFDIPSADTQSLMALAGMVDAVAVWGGDAAISSVRALAPTNVKLIEWGHKLSFAYVSQAGESEDELEQLAKVICESEQLLCSSPQGIYYETDDFEDLKRFAGRFAQVLERTSARYAGSMPDSAVQAEVTQAVRLAEVEQPLGKVFVEKGDGWSVFARKDGVLEPSAMFRNVWVKPLKRRDIVKVLQGQYGYLQTVGLICAKAERQGLGELFWKSGAVRVVDCGDMLAPYVGEPHDGRYPLREYTKKVVYRKRW